MNKENELKTFTVSFISGHDLKYKVKTVTAKDEKNAIEIVFNAEGRDFENRLVSVTIDR